MRLLKLTLENFQGLRFFEFEPKGGNASLFGDNATGKTTVANGITWLLFDKPSHEVKNFTPKTNDAAGGEMHHLHHSAEGVFLSEDGTAVTLKKDFYEDWRKKRGSSTEEFAGHNTDYFVDGVPVKQKAYLGRIDQICPPERARVLTVPEYFPGVLNWQDRRNILLDVCGDLGDWEVIESTHDLGQLPSFLLRPGTKDKYYTVEEFRLIAGARKSELNKKLESIPTRIDEVSRSLPDIKGIDVAVLDELIAEAERAKMALEGELASLSMDSVVLGNKGILADLNLEMSQAKAAHLEKYNQLNAATGALLTAESERNRVLVNEISSLNHEKSLAEKELSILEAKRVSISALYQAELAKTWQGETICQTCGQALPEDRVVAAQEAWNLAKSKRLEAINDEGKSQCSKSMVVELKARIANLAGAIAEKEATLEGVMESIAGLKAQMLEVPSFESTMQYENLQASIAQIKGVLNDDSLDLVKQKQGYRDKIDGLKGEIQGYEAKKMSVAMAKTAQDRVRDLEAEEKMVAGEYEHFLAGIYLCDLFFKTKVSLLTEKINERFTKVRFRLFVTQINGGLKEDCEVLIPCEEGLVPYSNANNGARINAGLEIIDVLGKAWGVTMPVCVDNAESVTDLMAIDAQVIRLVVSAPDKTLRIE